LNFISTALVCDEENIEQVYVVEAMDGQLITNKLIEPLLLSLLNMISSKPILKRSVV
jgi:hypothetical protein